MRVPYREMQRLARLAGALGIATMLPTDVLSQDAMWLSSPGSSAYNASSNWTPSVVPTGTAVFGSSDRTSIDIPFAGGATTTIATFRFDAGAPAYTFNVSSALRFTGT